MRLRVKGHISNQNISGLIQAQHVSSLALILPLSLKNLVLKEGIFENFILQQILSWASLQLTAPELFYWKSKAEDREIDFVIYSVNNAVGIEVKSSGQVTFGDTRPMRNFLKSHPEVSKGIIVYTGNKIYPIATNIYAVPWVVF